MPLIDDQGRLFGRINVIDALVVLLVLAVAAAGVALLSGSAPTETDTSPAYTTLTVGPISEDAASELTSAENLTLIDSERTLNFTDTHLTPHPSTDDALAVVRLNTTGTTLPPVNEGIDIAIGQYRFNATVSGAGASPTLSQTNTSVLVATSVPAQTATTIAAGDTQTIGPQTAATVTNVYQRTVGDNSAQLIVGLNLQTLQSGNTAQYASHSLRLGTTVPLRTPAYTLSGTVINRTTDSVPTQTRTVKLDTTVPQSTADALEPGDTFAIGGRDIATIEAVQPITLADSSQQRLLLSVSLRTLSIDGDDQFLTRPVRVGTSIPFRTSEYTLSGEITTTDANAAQPETRSVQIETTVSRSVADTIRAGDTYTISNTSVATIDSVASYPTNNPNRRFLQLGLSVQTVSIDDRAEYLNRPLRIGTTIPFETDAYALSGEIASLGATRPGDPVDATLEIEWRNVPPRLVEGLSIGQAEQHRGADARITNIQTEPATVILESDDGQIYARDHPVNKDVTLTLDVTARESDAGLSFHGRQAQRGDSITLDFGTLSVDGTLISIDED
jgi:hypothetical protein